MFAAQSAGMQPMLMAPQQMAGQLPAPAMVHAAADGSTQALAAPRESMIDIQRIEGQVRESSIARSAKWSRGRIRKKRSPSSRTWLHQPVCSMSRAKSLAKDDVRQLSGPERSAILMLSLGEDHASQVWKMLDDEEVKEISQVMSTLGTVSSTLVEKLLIEFVSQDVGHRLADGFV